MNIDSFKKIDLAKIVALARSLPRWAWLVAAFGVLVIVAVIAGSIQRPAVSTTPAVAAAGASPSVSRVDAKQGKAETKRVTLPARAAAVPAPAATAAAVVAGGPLVMLLPAQQPPAGLAPGHVAYTLESAQPTVRYGTTPGSWMKIGAATVRASTSAFGSQPDHDLAGMLPGTGFMRETWTLWTQIQHDGQHVIAVRLAAGAGAAATVTVDGQPRPTVQVAGGAGEGAQNQIGSADLASGWHELTVALEQRADLARAGSADVELFIRGPSAASPVSIVPFAPYAAAESSVTATTPNR